MKVLLFSHIQDIDGMGSVILGELAFTSLDYVLCKTFEVTDIVSSYYDKGELYNYDYVYITDLCIKEPLLGKIDKDEKLNGKILVFDHHITEIQEGNDKYNFVNIIVENEKGKTCGTSLFYDYLLKQGYLKKNETLDQFVELTRQHDTWEWKTKYNNPLARDLYILFGELGYEEYLNIWRKIVRNNKGIIFSSEEQKIIDDYNKKFNNDIKFILDNMKPYVLSIDDEKYKIGFIKCPYKYRNDINELVKDNNKQDVDLIGMIFTDMDTVSYRLVKNKDASKVAVYFGGKGHRDASSNLKDNYKFKKVLEDIGEI